MPFLPQAHLKAPCVCWLCETEPGDTGLLLSQAVQVQLVYLLLLLF